MAGIVVTSPDAEKLAKLMKRFMSPAGLSRLRRRSVNLAGKEARRETRSIGPALFGASATALGVKARAAAPGRDPSYRLYTFDSIPVERLKPRHRRISRKSGRSRLTIDTPALAKELVFGSVRREKRRIRLNKAGGLPERAIGGVERRRFAFLDEDQGGYPELASIRRRTSKRLVVGMRRAVEEHFARVR